MVAFTVGGWLASPFLFVAALLAQVIAITLIKRATKRQT